MKRSKARALPIQNAVVLGLMRSEKSRGWPLTCLSAHGTGAEKRRGRMEGNLNERNS